MTNTRLIHMKTLYQSLIFALVMAFNMVGSTWAQDDQTAAKEDQNDEEAVELDRIEVTGSLIKRKEFTTTSPVQVITANTQVQVGQLTVADMLQNSTVAGGTTQLNNQFAGFVIQGGTGVQTLDLRGLGTTRTLVLLNGRRPGGSGTRGRGAGHRLVEHPRNRGPAFRNRAGRQLLHLRFRCRGGCGEHHHPALGRRN